MEHYYEKIQKKLSRIIKANQTTVVEILLTTLPELRDNIINLRAPFMPEKKTGECGHCLLDDVAVDQDSGFCETCHNASSETREVSQWYLIDDDWARRFYQNGLVVLQAFGCSWFGRTGGGQSLCQDQDLDFLVKRKKSRDREMTKIPTN